VCTLAFLILTHRSWSPYLYLFSLSLLSPLPSSAHSLHPSPLLCSPLGTHPSRSSPRQFEELLTDLERPLHAIVAGISALRSSSGFRQALAAVLSVGNYLNGGSVRGQADGFDVSFLAVLDNTKDVDNKVSLAAYCSTLMKAQFGEAAPKTMIEQLAPVPEAARFCLKNVVGDIRKFVADVKAKKKAATVVALGSKSGFDQVCASPNLLYRCSILLSHFFVLSFYFVISHTHRLYLHFSWVSCS
jgi:hypothetical protein